MFKPNFQKADNWTIQFQDIKNAKTELKDNEMIMTGYEKQSINKAIKERIEANFQNIYQGATSMFLSDVEQYKAAKAKLDDARAKEITRWDSRKLNDEINYLLTRTKKILSNDNPMDPNYGRIDGIFSEVKASQDPYKIRAMAEALDSIDPRGMDQHSKAQFISMRNEAKQAAQQTRITQGIQDAEGEVLTAKDNLAKTKQVYRKIAETMDGNDPGSVWGGGSAFSNTYKTVEFDNSGEPVFYSEDDSHVTGIRMKSEEGVV